MASTHQTKAYGLSQWVETDPVLREDFNENNCKIDKALQDKSNMPVVGEYTGNSDVNNQTWRAISLGFRPLAVIIFPRSDAQEEDGNTETYHFRIAMAVSTEGSGHVRITNDGFEVKRQLNAGNNTGYGSRYMNPRCYIAFR